MHDGTLRRLGWDEEWKLLSTAEDAGFEVLLSGDRKIPQEQNMDGHKIGIVVLTAHQLSIVSAYVSEISAAIHAIKQGTITVVECGEFRR